MEKQFININKTNLDLIKGLYTEFMDETHTGRPDDFNNAAVNFIDNVEGFITVLLNNSSPSGFVEYRKLPRKLRDNKSIVEITSLFVKEEYRKLGLGKDLIEYVKKFASKLEAYSIVLYSGLELEDAHKFYEKIGFKKSAYFFKMPLEI